VSKFLKTLATLLLLGTLSAAHSAVVVSSKLSSESAMIGHMIRLLLNAGGIQTVDRTTLGATPVVRKALLAGEIDNGTLVYGQFDDVDIRSEARYDELETQFQHVTLDLADRPALGPKQAM